MRLGLYLVACAVAAWLTGPASADPQIQQIETGRQIYLHGTAPGEEIQATLSDQDFVLPASSLPCANCHGKDGRGRPEGGVQPTDLRWANLSRPSVRRADGRSHPPYDRAKLVRAVTLGYDPAGHRLNIAMPRYRMSTTAASALVAYLQVLGSDAAPGAGEPGVDDQFIELATVQHLTGPRSQQGRAVAVALSAWVDETNRQGGFYGRRIRWKILDAAILNAGSTDPPRVLDRLLAEEPPFALLAPDLQGLQAIDIPLIGPLSDATREAIDPVAIETIFYLRRSDPETVEDARRRALDAAEVLAEGLRRSGRRLSRESFVEALEGLYRFDPGYGPEVTFGPNRRVGAD